ncbi:uncharacterized protein [Fopius arisanus]|uniref:AroB protein n=1 Tax=Fopius arisanus TaxID=64838 RepID=A0A0C9RC97_9HYME|nr:PREDICTED: uncharacterized protein LOC105265488 [Fopius arisanus]
MKIYMLLFFAIGTYGQSDWTADLRSNIDRITEDINNNVHQLQQKIHANVQDNLARIDLLKHNIDQQVEKINEDVKNGKQTVIINGGGSTRSVISGTLPNGETYFHDIEERKIGDTLHRFESLYNPQTQQVERYHTILDLKDPNAKPIPARGTGGSLPVPTSSPENPQNTPGNPQKTNQEG